MKLAEIWVSDGAHRLCVDVHETLPGVIRIMPMSDAMECSTHYAMVRDLANVCHGAVGRLMDPDLIAEIKCRIATHLNRAIAEGMLYRHPDGQWRYSGTQDREAVRTYQLVHPESEADRVRFIRQVAPWALGDSNEGGEE